MADCTITGTLKDAHGEIVKNAVLKITPLSVTGVLMSSVERVVRSNSSGVYSFTLIQGGYYNISGRGVLNFEEEDGGTNVTIPAAGSATLEALQSVASIPTQGLTLQNDGVALSGYYGTLNLVNVTLEQTSAGVAKLTFPVTSSSVLTTLGDMLYRNGSDLQRLAGNTLAARRFLTQTGNGVISAAPGWNAIVAGDIPDLSATYQPLDSDLTTIGGLSPSNDDFLQRKSGAWANRTINQVKIDLLTNLDTTMFAANVFDTDATLAAASASRIAAQSAVKSYIDNIASGLKWKASAVVATTANITLTGEQTIDGVAVIAGDRVLVKDQSTASENGIYVAASGAWARATDADTAAKIKQATLFVESGTVNSDTQWTLTNNTITLGSTSLTFAQVARAGTYSAGTGLSLTGNQFAINDAELLALAGLTSAANKLPYFTGAGTAALADFSAFGRSLVDDADAAAARATLAVAGLADSNTFTAKQTIQLTTLQMCLAYDGSNKTDFTVSSAGNLLVNPSGGRVQLFGTTSSQPGLENSSGKLKVVRADGSAGEILTNAIYHDQNFFAFGSSAFFQARDYVIGWSSSTSNWSAGLVAGLTSRAADIVEVNNGSAGTYRDLLARGLRSNAVTFANAIASPVEGTLQAFTDSTTATWGATITGGGSNHVLGYYNGTNWTVAAK